MADLVAIGEVRKTHGYNGEVKLIVHEGYEDDIELAKFIFIGKTPETTLPYELRTIRGNDFICRLDGVSSKEQAAELRGKVVYLKRTQVTSVIPDPVTSTTDDEYGRLVGFALHDQTSGASGVIASIEAYPQQTMAVVTIEGREVLVPLIDAFIVSEDQSTQTLHVELPNGLLEL